MIPIISSSTTTYQPFKVVQINKQVTDSTSVKSIDDKLKLKTTIKSEINSIDQALQQTKLQTESFGKRDIKKYSDLCFRKCTYAVI